MIYLWIALAVWLIPGIILGGRRARAWYAEAYKEHLETFAEHKRKDSYHYCYRGAYMTHKGSFDNQCYRRKPTRPEAVGEGLWVVLAWPFQLALTCFRKTTKALGNASFGGVEKKINNDLNAKWELEKMQFFQKYTKEFEDLAFSYRMITKYRESECHNQKITILRHRMLNDEARPSLASTEAIDLVLQTYKHDSESLKETKGITA